MRVFLGGTVADSAWRKKLIPLLEIDYFDPTVAEWDEQAYQNELFERDRCDYNLYVLTPRMIGYYSIAEVTDDAMKKSERTIFCFFKEDDGKEFDEPQILSLEAVGNRVISYGAVWARSLEEIAAFLNYSNANDQHDKSNETIKREADYVSSHAFIEEFATRWIQSGRSEKMLWHPSYLKQGLIKWHRLTERPAEHLPEVTSDIREFVEASQAHSWENRKIGLFISYSRNPSSAFARGFYESIKNQYDVWFDKVSIPHGEDFKVSIEKGIRASDNFIYIITRNSVLSRYCQAELDIAKSYRKRIIPVQQEAHVDEALIDPEIRDINRIFPIKDTTTDRWDYDGLAEQIRKVTSLHSDLLDKHTSFLEKALSWKQNDFNSKKLIDDKGIELYEKWINDLNSANIKPSPVSGYHQEFYAESLSLSKVGYRECWVAGIDGAVFKMMRQHFSMAYDPVRRAPSEVLKVLCFLYIVNKHSVTSEVYKSQLQLARTYAVPVCFLVMDQVEFHEELHLSPEDAESVITGFGTDQIRILKELIRKHTDTGFQDYYQSHCIPTYHAYSWEQTNKSKAHLLRGRVLAHFDNYRKTYSVGLADIVHQYLNASLAQESENEPYDVFLCRPKNRINFSVWLAERLLNQNQITCWNQYQYLNFDSANDRENVREELTAAINVIIILAERGDSTPDDYGCEALMDLAIDLKKRIFIVKADESRIPGKLEKYPVIDFRNHPDQAVFELIGHLTSDQEFIRFCSDTLKIALEWKKNEALKELLFSGFRLESAQKITEGRKNELPDSLLDFLIASEEERLHKERQQKIRRRIINALSILSVSLALLAFVLMLNAENARKDALDEKENALCESENALYAEQVALDEKVNALCAEEDALYKEEVARTAREEEEEAKNEARSSEQQAIESQKRAESVKEEARRENRLSTALINAYQVRNTADRLIDASSLQQAVFAYYFHKNDKGDPKYTPDIFTALFKVATSEAYASEVKAIKTWSLPDADKPYTLHALPKEHLLFILCKTALNYTLTMTNSQMNPVSSFSINISHIQDGVPSPDGKCYWITDGTRLQKIDLTGKGSEASATSISNVKSIRKLAVSNLYTPQSTGRNPESNAYVLALRSEESIELLLVQDHQLHSIYQQRHPAYPYPDAIDIYLGPDGTYRSCFAVSDSLIFLTSPDLYHAPDHQWVIFPNLDAGERITSLCQNGNWVAIGTSEGKIAITTWNLLRAGNPPLFRNRAKSSIKQLVMDSVFYAAVTYGNQFETTKILLNTLSNESANEKDIGIGLMDLMADDIINDIAIDNDQLIYIENNSVIKYHTLNVHTLSGLICSLLENCPKDKKAFFREYEGEQSQQGNLEFCKCGER